MLALGDNVNALLRYDRGAIAAGGWWRLLTAHLVHLDAHHLILNELGLVLMWSLFAGGLRCGGVVRHRVRRRLGDQLGPVVAESAGRMVRGRVRRAATVMAAGAARHLVERAWDRWLLIGLLAAKLPTSSWVNPAATSSRWWWSMPIYMARSPAIAVGAALSRPVPL